MTSLEMLDPIQKVRNYKTDWRRSSLPVLNSKYYLRREGTSFVWDKILFSSALATDDSRAGFGVRVIRVSWNFLLVRTLSLRFSTEPCKEYENPIFIQDTTVSILHWTAYLGTNPLIFSFSGKLLIFFRPT